ncbi:MAG TPA: MoaD/ThiS family protein [Marmoricola sp.]|jgi:molybdopterin converting factor small subunit|nr:MoaD/ThiS family protein [Marmoricola sp.]
MSGAATQDDPGVGQITLRYWASARAAAGVAQELVDVAGTTALADLLASVIERHGAESPLARILPSCSLLVGDQPVSSRDAASVRVAAGETVEFLPPFAGG